MNADAAESEFPLRCCGTHRETRDPLRWTTTLVGVGVAADLRWVVALWRCVRKRDDDGHLVEAGVYFARLEAAGEADMWKMVMLK